MTKGALVFVTRTPLTIGVLIHLDDAAKQARVLPWNGAKGRWSHPIEIDTPELVPAPIPPWDTALSVLVFAATSNIRRYSGVVVYGRQSIRVWPNAHGPEAAS